ncbi:NACHT, LRR and PYD domains-containing protein 1-like isoform X4 [Scleropages formosus]|uniref:NACHT, LRR and PYD domains-containing protein 1-like n=1 Tax=Scleropages formosus TaxID=113540 RepID=A0A8C9T9H2_SCLFO|nr:NACHT, LRR and PYD domains-containing protein 1-like isoform X4 [Scleropages formosus]
MGASTGRIHRVRNTDEVQEAPVGGEVADPDSESKQPAVLRDFGLLGGSETNDGLLTRLRNRKPNFQKFRGFSRHHPKTPSSCKRRTDAQDTLDVQPSPPPQEHPSPPSLLMSVDGTEDDPYKVDRFTAKSAAEMSGCEFPTVITPTLKQNNGHAIYSVLCSQAGWFQCRETHLMFRMKDMGEVVYSTASWAGTFHIPTGWTPAGPLWDIKCPQETLSQITFPHCEIFTGERRDFLSVAHVTVDGVEILSPLEVNDTHVTISITDLSLFGLITSWLSHTIRGQILLFLRPIFEDQERILNVFLLPSNVLLTQVQGYQKDSIHIPTSSVCTLTHEREYSVYCDLEEKHYIQPKKEKFYRFIDVNFYPTFEVFLYTDVKDMNMKVMDQEQGTEVWKRKVKLPAFEKILSHPLEAEQAANFVYKHRATLIERVTLMDPILDKLSTLVHPEACAKVRAAATSQEKMRLLYDITFRSGGTEVKSRFFEILKDIHPHLVQELNSIY